LSRTFQDLLAFGLRLFLRTLPYSLGLGFSVGQDLFCLGACFAQHRT
jgi:hypothetical protein